MSFRSRPVWVYVSLTALLVVLLLTLWLGGDSADKQGVSQPETADVVFEESAPVDVGSHKSSTEKYKEVLPAPETHRGIALILDDVGYDLPALRRMLALQIPVAIAILPNAPHAAEAAELAHAAGRPVMLHMPMEPANPHYRQHMDDSFIRIGMQRQEVRRRMKEALARVPYVEGVNNHMGSGLTAQEEPMRWVMEVCRENSLFFVDSRTNKDSVAARMARESGLQWGERRIFLDNSVAPDLLKKSWQAARKRLERDGFVIVIFHPHRETLDFLQREISDQDKASMVPLGRLLHAAQTE